MKIPSLRRAIALAAVLAGTPAFAAYPEVGNNDQILSASGYYSTAHRSLASAYNPARNEYFVVFYGNQNNPRRIYGFFVNGDDGSSSAPFELSDTGVAEADPSSYWPFDPNIDVAFSPEHQRYLVVWSGDRYPDADGAGPHDEVEIYGRLINATTHEPAGGRINVSHMPLANSRARHPSVAWSSAGSVFWVAWSARDAVQETEIFVEAISPLGERIRGALEPRRLSTSGSDENIGNFVPSEPDIECGNDRCLLVWTQNRVIDTDQKPDEDSSRRDVVKFVINGTEPAEENVTISGQAWLSNMAQNKPAVWTNYFLAVSPDIAWNADTEEFLVAWHGHPEMDFGGLYNFDIFAQRVSYSGGLLGSRVQVSDFEGLGPTSRYARVRYDAGRQKYLVSSLGTVYWPEQNGNVDYSVYLYWLSGTTASSENIDTPLKISDTWKPNMQVYPTPAIAGAAGRYLATWSRHPQAVTDAVGGQRVHGQLLDFNIADLATSAAASASEIPAGNDATFTVDVENLGSDPARDTHLYLTQTGGTNFVELPEMCLPGEGHIDCALGDIAPGGAAETLEIAIGTDAAKAGETVTLIAGAATTTWDETPGNDESSASVTLAAPGNGDDKDDGDDPGTGNDEPGNDDGSGNGTGSGDHSGNGGNEDDNDDDENDEPAPRSGGGGGALSWLLLMLVPLLRMQRA